MDLQRKSVTFEIKATDDEARTIEGYASTFGNIDQGGDIILPGAFADSIKRRIPKMLAQHDTGCVIGIWTAFSEDQNGLYVKGKFANTSDGNDMYELAKLGAIDSMSIGYSPIDSDYGDNGVRTLKKVELWEVSLVTFPMNEQAKITAVKNKPTERDLEKYLRDVGFSQREAKAIIADGYKAIDDQRDVEAQALITSINHATNILKGHL